MARLLALLVCLVLLGGCDLTGSRSAQRHVDPGPSDSEDVGVKVSHIRVGQGVVTFTVEVPGGPAGCAGRPRAQVVSYDAQQVTVDTVVPSSLSSACRGHEQRSFSTDLALQGRQLRVNGVLYQVDAAGTGVAACDSSLGCNPPPDRCDPAWTSRVIPHYDLPPAKRTRVVACHPHWLVLDVTATVPSGAVQHVRWFAELDPQRSWLVVASTRTGGCVDVRLAVPSFPVAYCRNLKPPGKQKTPGG